MVGNKHFQLCAIFFLIPFLDTYMGVKVSNYLKDFQGTSDPDTFLTPPKIIRRHGYPAEAHIIQSEDGYLLEYHRIPHGKAGPKSKKPYPILLHHGLLCSSIDWIINGPEKALGYLLADAGYDVWMANARGNTYSRSHISMSPKDREFWNFTFHEMGVYDIPAAIDYILNTTDSQKLIYIGHSLGTTAFYAFSSSRPEYNNKVKVHIGMAPVAMLGHTTSAFRLLVPYAKKIESMSDWYNKGAFLERDLMTQIVLKFLCDKSLFSFNVCEQLIIFKLFGKDVQQFNQSLQPMLMSHMPAGTSGKNMIHCSQLISSGKFMYYDYGLAENIRKYGFAKPPAYDLSKISVPVKFYYGQNDILACPTDVKLLYQKLPKPMGCTAIDYEKWSHVDFLWAIDVNKLFHNQLLDFVGNVSDTPDFVMKTVQRALRERAHKPTPSDEPFDEISFMNNNFNGLPTLDNITEILVNFPDINSIAEYPNMMKQKIDESLDKVKTVQETMQKTGRSIQEGLEETASNIKKSVETTLTETKNMVENSAKDIGLKIKNTMNKLSHIFEL